MINLLAARTPGRANVAGVVFGGRTVREDLRDAAFTDFGEARDRDLRELPLLDAAENRLLALAEESFALLRVPL
jgi:hypothetical protein